MHPLIHVPTEREKRQFGGGNIGLTSLGLGATPAGFARFNPANLPGALIGYQSRHHVTISTNPLAAGTTPQAVTFTGARTNLTDVPALVIAIDGTGIVATATFKVSVDGGATFPVTGQTVQSSVTLTTPAIVNGLIVNFPAGTYTSGDTYTAQASVIFSQGSATSNVSQGTSTKQPIINWNSGGMPMITFDGVDDFLSVAGVGSIVQDEQIFAVFKCNDSNNATLLDGQSLNSMRLFRTGATQLSMYAGAQINTSAVTPEAWHVHEMYYNDNAPSYYKQDNVEKASGDIGASNGGGVTLGAAGVTGVAPSAISFVEYWLFQPALSAANTQRMYDYMANIRNQLV